MLLEASNKKTDQREIWVLAERHGERWDSVTLELLHDARTLAKRADLHVAAIIFSKPETVDDQAAQELASHGANEVILLENDDFCQPNGPLIYAPIVNELTEQRQIQMLLFPSTPLWVECASAIVSSINGAIVSNVMSFRLQGKQLEVTRYGWENKVQMVLTLPEEQPWIVCLRPNVAGVGAAKKGKKAEVIRLQVNQQESEQIQIEELLSPDPRELDLVEADRIVAGGRGIGPEGFELLEKVALLLEAGVGATRVAVDNGWIPYSRQIGQTGKTVKPRLYIAAGISGAAQHIDGIKGSEVIIVINNDPKASIYELADLSVVGDANEIIKELINALDEKTKAMMEVG